MAFDFSKYMTDPAATTTPLTQPDPFAQALPTGTDSTDIPKLMWDQGHTFENPDDALVRDTDGNAYGTLKDINPDMYNAQKLQYDEQQKLVNANLLNGPYKVGGAEGGDQQTISGGFGSAVPDIVAHRDGSPYQVTKENAPSQLAYAGKMNDSSGGADFDQFGHGTGQSQLIDPTKIINGENWGEYTPSYNIKHPEEKGWDVFWKVAPMLPGLFAM